MTTWINEKDWSTIQKSLPILCIDIIPYQKKDRIFSFGLIYRETPHEGDKWNTVGGRLLYTESLVDGINRQLFDALGDQIHIKEPLPDQPHYIAQYSPSFEVKKGFDAVDPRKHAIGLTYCIEIDGPINPRNEAKDFNWFHLDELPSEELIGFNQYSVIIKTISNFLEN